jgi:RimJ/RimL family protein N-acetyltransferase
VDIDLETTRLALRRFTAADEEHLMALDADPEVMRYLSGGAPTPRALIRASILPRFLEEGHWVAMEKFTGTFVGWFSLEPRGAGEFELGYRLRRAAWTRGFATEASCALLDRAFEEGAGRVVASTYEDNLPSRRVMEKLGMTLVRRFRFESDAQSTYDASASVAFDGYDVEYAITDEEWRRISR